MSFNPKPSYHLCPSFTIPPPPNGHIDLGSILKNLDTDGVDHPINIYCRIPVPEKLKYPLNGPDSKEGFTRTLKELRAVEASIWAKIFSLGGVRFNFLRGRSDDETLTVEKILTRYFSPTEEYMSEALAQSHVDTHLEGTSKREPVYMVTGYMYVEGAKLTKKKNTTTRVGGEASATDPNSGTSGGAKGGYTGEGSSSSGFDGSTPFILGLRVRKIWWDKKDGTRKVLDKVVGATLDDHGPSKESILNGLEFEDDFVAHEEHTKGSDVFDNEEAGLGLGPSLWAIPSEL